jgi:hypothetical protein
VKFALAIVVTLSLCGCSQDSAQQSLTVPPPTAPTPPASQTFLWGYVVDENGVCIEGAIVQVTGGQSVGQSITQTTPCGAYDYGNGFEFNNLTTGVAMTLRASAPGWSTCEYTVTPHGGGQSALILPLSRPGTACSGPWTWR